MPSTKTLAQFQKGMPTETKAQHDAMSFEEASKAYSDLIQESMKCDFFDMHQSSAALEERAQYFKLLALSKLPTVPGTRKLDSTKSIPFGLLRPRERFRLDTKDAIARCGVHCVKEVLENRSWYYINCDAHVTTSMNHDQLVFPA